MSKRRASALSALKWWGPPLEIGGSVDPYLRRWFVLPRNRIFNVYLHQFLRDDDDRALHDHPWLWNLSWLWGDYDEVVFARAPTHGAPLPQTVVRPRRRGQWVARGRAAHRIVLRRDEAGKPIPCWSLFLTGPVIRAWGFWCPSGRWVHWRAFTAGPRGEVIGAGCGEGTAGTPKRFASAAEISAQRESWVRGEMAIGLDRAEAADRAAWRGAGVPTGSEIPPRTIPGNAPGLEEFQ